MTSRPLPPSLSFAWVTTTRELDALEPVWRSLDDGRTPGAVFRSFEWQATWWRILGEDPQRRRALRVLVGRDEAGAVRGLLPLYVEDAAVARLFDRRRAALLADGVVGSDYLGLVARAEDQQALAPRFARRVADDPMLADVDLLDLCDLLAGDPLGAPAAFDPHTWRDVACVPRYRCPFIRLGGARDAYFEARPRWLGELLRRRRRALVRGRDVRLELRTTPDEVAEALGSLFALHRARWADEGGSQAIPDERVERFHRASARLLAERGWVRLATLSIRGEPAAATYGFVREGRFVYYQSGLSPLGRRGSAGTVVLAELIDRAFAEGLGEVDFLRGEESYKRLWADETRDTVSVRAVRATTRARAAAGAERAIAALRRAAKQALRRVRRA